MLYAHTHTHTRAYCTMKTFNFVSNFPSYLYFFALFHTCNLLAICIYEKNNNNIVWNVTERLYDVVQHFRFSYVRWNQKCVVYMYMINCTQIVRSTRKMLFVINTHTQDCTHRWATIIEWIRQDMWFVYQYILSIQISICPEFPLQLIHLNRILGHV